MRINVVLSLLKKEFLNIIRDRKSFIIMILLPILMFPLMIGLLGFILTAFTKVDSTIKFGVNYEITSDFKEYVENYDNKYNIEIIYDTEDDLKNMFDNEKIALFVIKNNNTYEIHFDENKTSGIANTNLIQKIYNDYRETYLTKKLNEKGIDYDALKNTFNIEYVHDSATEMGSFVPSIIAMVLIMIISSVCFSISIDVTTSEKEKGTLETLLSLPIKKTELITSKFLTVFTLSCLSGILAYISLFMTLFFARGTLDLLGVSSISITPSILLIYLIAIILVSLLFSGLLLSITIFSKNLKEAQNSLYPMELLITLTSLLPLLGMKANLKYALIPFVNISLLFNNALSSIIDPLFVIITFLSTIIYAIILIIIVSKIYNQEDVLFSTKSLSYINIKNGKSKTICYSIPLSLLIAVITYLLATYFSLLFATTSKYFLMSVMPITIGLVILISGLIIKLDFKNNFKFQKFSIKKFLVLCILYVATYVIANFIVNYIVRIFPSIADNFNLYSSYITFDNLFLSILVIAFLPALFEELLFRGVIFNSFNKKYGLVVGIIVSSLLFGIYHMNLVQGIYAFICGILLGYSYYKTKSLYVPIIFHFINNFISTILSYYNYNINIPISINIILVIVSIILIIIVIYINKLLENKK